MRNKKKESDRRKQLLEKMFQGKEEGIDGLLVTVGLCIIALLLCVVLKDALADFITTLVDALTARATEILG